MRALLSFLFLITSLSVFSQSTCETALPFCANGVSGVTFPATVNQPPAQAGPNYGCLFTQPNPAWYYLQIATSGNLDILIQGTITAPPGPGSDVDFICWGPFSSLAGICNSLTPSFSVDCSYSGSFTETLNIPNGIAGEYYMVLITNFANIQQNILFTQYAGTGSTNCALLTAASSSICAGSTGTVVATNTGNLLNPTYSIQPGGISNITGTFIVTPTVTTNYTLFVTGLNSQSVATTQTAAATVTVNSLPVVAPTTTQASCTSAFSAINLGLTFNPVSPAPSYTVLWNPPPAGVTSATQTIVNNPGAGIYTAVVVAAGGCSATAAFTVNTQPTIPAFTLNPQGPNFTVTCSNPTITINATDPGLNYNWVNGVSAPITGSVANFNNLNLGTWSVTGTDPFSNCIKTHTLTVFQNIIPPTSTITPVFQSITCANPVIQTITTTATPSTNVEHQFYWDATYGGGSLTGVYSGTAVVVPGPGTHTYVLINLLNGCTVTKTFTIATGSGFPTYTITSPVQHFSVGCTGKDIVDINIVNGNTNPPGGALNYTILPPGQSGPYTVSAQSGYTFQIFPNPTVFTPGTYTVIGKDPVSGCETRVPVSIIQNTIAPHREVTAITRTLSCFTPSVVLLGSSNTPNTGYQWKYPTAPGVLPGTTYTVNVTGAPSTTAIAVYTFVVTDNTNACINTTLIPMYQNIYVPIAKINPPFGSNGAISCKSPSIILTNGSSTGIPPTSTFPTGSLTIARLWEGPSPQIPLQNNSTYIALQPGTYSLNVQDMNNGCYNNTVFVVADNRDYPVVNNPLVPAPSVLDCGATSATVTAIITGTVPVKYEWFDSNGLVKTATLTAGSGTVTAAVTNLGEYPIIVTNEANGCISTSKATVVSGTLDAAFVPDRTTGYAPLTVNFTNQSSSALGSGSITSVWSFGNGGSATVTSVATNTSTIYNQPGTYTVTLFANKGACQDAESKIIVVELPSKLEVPNVFTPNGDGANDLFFLRTANLTEIKASIYDRWGNLVYEINSSTGNIEWDGKNQAGKEVAEGTYFYIITSTGKDGVPYDTKGTVNLYR